VRDSLPRVTTQSNTPAGWYADPHGTPDLLRWWDGSRWTDHTHAGTQPKADTASGAQDRATGAPGSAGRPGAAQPGVPQQGGPGQPGGPGQQGFPQQGGFPQQAQPHPGFAPQQAAPGAAGPQAGYGYPAQTGAPQKDNPWELGIDGPADPGRVRQQVQQQAGVGPSAAGGGTLFTEPVLVVNQKAKLIEISNEYAVFDRNGTQLGSVAEIGQGAVKKAVRFLSSADQFMTHKLEVRDAWGQPVLLLTRPAKFIKSKVMIDRPDGTHLGEIVQQNAIGRIRFGFMVDGQQIGAIKAENFRAWNFAIVDHTETEIARITKTWEGLVKAAFTTADNYVLQIHRPLADPLLSMVVASALTVDTALKQDSR
jgi:uncharacterized protein YxjI